MDTKICTACGLEKKLTEFNKHPRGKYGLQSTCKDCNKSRCKAYRERIIKEVIDHYGGKCVCQPCGETNPMFLTLDHIDNNGAEQRRQLGGGKRGASTDKFYRWVIKNNFPNDYQVLCYNCNCGKQRNGGQFCPHLPPSNNVMIAVWGDYLPPDFRWDAK